MLALLPGEYPKSSVSWNYPLTNLILSMLTETKIPVATEQQSERKGRKAKLALALLCVGLSTLATLPFFFMGRSSDGSELPTLRMPITHDMPLQLEQMKSFYNGLASGELYPRWEEDTNRGYGAPTTSYYPPGLYYLTSACYWMTGDWIIAILVTHLIMMIASAAAIYFYARQTMSPGAAALAMSAYIFLPYHLIDQYHRGAMAELMGFVWTPLILLFGERLINSFSQARYDGDLINGEAPDSEPRRPRAIVGSGLLLNIAGLAAVYSAFVWSHPPTAYQFTLALGAFALVYAWARKNWKGLLFVGSAIAMGLAMAAYYLYPAAVEQNLIRHQYVEESWPYHDSYVFVYAEPYATNHRGFFNLIDGAWSFNTVLIIFAALALLLLWPQAARMTRGLRERVLSWTMMGCVASFLMTSLSYPLGRWIPKIDIGVFSWRMLSITTLALALLVGACAEAAANALRDRERRGLVAFRSLLLFILTGGFIFSAAAVVIPKARNPVFVPSTEHINLATIPSAAPREIEDLPAGGRAETESSRGRISIERWDSEYRALRVELAEPDRLHIRTFNFPGWTALVNGSPSEIITGQEFGEIVIELPPGEHDIKLDYLDTPPRRLGLITTIASFSLLIAMLIVHIVARKFKTSVAS